MESDIKVCSVRAAEIGSSGAAVAAAEMILSLLVLGILKLISLTDSPVWKMIGRKYVYKRTLRTGINLSFCLNDMDIYKWGPKKK